MLDSYCNNIDLHDKDTLMTFVYFATVKCKQKVGPDITEFHYIK